MAIINPSERTLKMANWVCRSFDSVYEPYAKLHRGGVELINGGCCTTDRITTCLRSRLPIRLRCPTRDW